jgi:nucleotide-binding universal stress UspA family protein
VKRIIVGVDGSEHARTALAWAADEARLRSATLEVAMVWSYPYYADPVGGVYPRMAGFADLEQQEQNVLDAEIARVIGENTNGLTVDAKLLAGSTVPTLLEAAAGADLLVVGSRGRGGFGSLLLGSTSQHLVHHAPCPIVIVPTPKPPHKEHH